MAQVWVRAKSILHTETNGQNLTYHPGDWLQVGKGQAKEWLQHNQCEILRPAILQSVQDLTNCSILLSGNATDQLRDRLIFRFPAVPVERYNGDIPQGRFLLWNTEANLNQDLILTGFNLLTKWQMAIPLLDYDTLAGDIGAQPEQAITQDVIHDLRVPVYDCRVIFARQCQEVRRLLELWDGVGQLSFLRALYQARPIVNALPPSWVMV